MLKDLFFLVLIQLAFIFTASAQEVQPWCGTTGAFEEMIMDRLRENKAALQRMPIESRSTKYIPVKFHLIAEADGSGMAPKERVLEQLCLMNEAYEDLGLQFYLKDGFNYILNDMVYADHLSIAGQQAMQNNRVNNAINIYLPNTIGLDVVGVRGYYDPSDDWLVILKAEVGKKSLTFMHELGHFFSLAHPFFGWDDESWDQAIHGNPVMMAIAPNGQTPVELVDGSNCNTAGDEVCDTPADYGFGLGWPNCNFNSEVRDRNGDILDPDERLWVGYFFGCNYEDYYYTEMQQQLILQDYNSLRRSYIQNSHVPNQSPINGEQALTTPADEQAFEFYNAIPFEWEAKAGADAYLLQVSLVPTFSSSLTAYSEVVYGTFKEVEVLAPNRTYYWRVLPFNAYQTCSSFSPVRKFSTGALVTTQDSGRVQLISISPNPARSGRELKAVFESNEAFEISPLLYRIDGALARRYGRQRITSGLNQFSLATTGLSAGVYILKIDSPEGQFQERIVLSN